MISSVCLSHIYRRAHKNKPPMMLPPSAASKAPFPRVKPPFASLIGIFSVLSVASLSLLRSHQQPCSPPLTCVERKAGPPSSLPSFATFASRSSSEQKRFFQTLNCLMRWFLEQRLCRAGPAQHCALSMTQADYILTPSLLRNHFHFLVSLPLNKVTKCCNSVMTNCVRSTFWRCPALVM